MHRTFDENMESKWTEVQIFTGNNINIVKIAITSTCSLFLDDTGVTWRCGSVDNDIVYVSERMNHFIVNDIKIKDIQCGTYNTKMYHNRVIYRMF